MINRPLVHFDPTTHLRENITILVKHHNKRRKKKIIGFIKFVYRFLIKKNYN